MLHAAAILAGIFLFWLLFTQLGGGPAELALGFGAALACTALALRFGGAGAEYARMPALAVSSFARIGNVLGDTMKTLRKAAAADVTVRPALVRVRTRAGGPFTRGALTGALSAAAGAVVVDGDADTLLVHVLDEDAVDAADLGRLEDQVHRLAGGA